MKLGAIQTAPPAAIQPLGARARLSLMEPPPRADWLAACPADGDPLGNDRLGNCVPCAMLRTVQLRRANAWGDAWRPDAAEAVALYAELAGYDPVTGAHDGGTDTAAAMLAWARTGIATQQALDIVRWATVAPAAGRHLRLAIAHTGPVQATLALPIGAEDPESWAREPGQGDAWQPGTWGNHRVLVGAYDGDALVCRSWGRDLALHPAFWSRYALGVDVTLSRQWLDATGLSPAGLDWIALEGDMAALSS